MTSILIKNWGKIITLAMVILLVFMLLPTISNGADIKLYVNGQAISPDAKPYMANDRTFVPMRFAAEPLGAVAEWEGGSVQTATITKGDTVVKIKIGSKIATINGQKYTLDAAAAVKQDRTFVPMRFIGEALNATVEWDGKNSAVRITTADGNVTPPDSGNNDLNKSKFQYLGYYYSQASLENLQDFRNELTGAIHFAYSLQSDGAIAKKDRFSADKFYGSGGGYETAEAKGMDTSMLVTGFSSGTLTSVLSNPTARAKAINQIAQTISDNNLDGVDLDFESVKADQRANLVTFTKELRAKIGNNKRLTLSSMPRSAANQTWLNGYDYKGLSQYADYLILMCYNEHYSGGSPGPVASAKWVKEVIQYTLNQGVSKDKIIVALGSYGYDWPSGKKGSSLTNSAAHTKAAQYGATVKRDEASGCLFYNYTDESGLKHSVWFEDSVSLGKKAALAKQYNLGGLAFWRLGFYTTDIWSSILTNTNHANAGAWQNKAGAAENIPVAPGDNSDGSKDIENNGDFVPQS